MKFQLRHGNDLLAMDAIKDSDVSTTMYNLGHHQMRQSVHGPGKIYEGCLSSTNFTWSIHEYFVTK